MKLFQEKTLAPQVAWAAPELECGFFPGACVKQDGSMALLLVSGSEFESADHRVMAFTGSPDGLEWTAQGNWGEIRQDGVLFSACAKPTALADGRLLALGYGYMREQPEYSISAYAEKFGHFPTVKNFVAFSEDGGCTYSAPTILNLPRAGIEFSGPAIQLDDGRLLAFGPPFNVDDKGQIGLCYESLDNGVSWQEKSVYHEGNTVTSWESRGIVLGGQRVAVILWAFDCEKQQHLTNRIAYSDDAGATWRVTDTGIPGQAANLVDLGDGKVGVLYAKRSGEAPGVYLCHGHIAGDGSFVGGDTEMLYDAAQGANAQGNILTQFCNLKFGQPSMLRLKDGGYLLLFWRKFNERYEVVIRKYWS